MPLQAYRFAVILFVAAACGSPAADRIEAPPSPPRESWSRATASRYHTARSDQWLDERPCALSCHTTVPFVLISEGSGTRSRILAEVSGRIAAWPDVEVWYGSDADETARSLGTEAVLNALAVGGTKDSTRALELMFEQQRPDGGWHWLDFGLAPWEGEDADLAGAAFALIAIGRASYHPPAAKLTALLELIAARKRDTLHRHHQLMLLWASRDVAGVLTQPEIRAYAAEVRTAQRPDGGFSLADLGPWARSDGSANLAIASDGYATAFAAYVLGQLEDRDSLAAAAAARCWLIGRQAASGSWPGRSVNDDDDFNQGLMTDAATAYSVLALSQAHAVACR
jgi:hypothetical protein